jgi:signal transduction histidine kinase
MDSHDNAPGPAAAHLRELGIRCGVGAPIIVDGRLWGAAVVGSRQPEPLPPDTEARIAHFTDLVATAIANAETCAELTASRARVVAAADEARRRVERDLHDGAQQRLVSLGLALRTAEATQGPDFRHRYRAGRRLAGPTRISRGIHPAILSKGGLGPALKTLARRSTVDVEGGSLRLSIRDDGIGGADIGKGSGLTGLIDRVEALGGTIEISSHAGNGTSLLVKIPLEVQ